MGAGRQMNVPVDLGVCSGVIEASRDGRMGGDEVGAGDLLLMQMPEDIVEAVDLAIEDDGSGSASLLANGQRYALKRVEQTNSIMLGVVDGNKLQIVADKRAYLEIGRKK